MIPIVYLVCTIEMEEKGEKNKIQGKYKLKSEIDINKEEENVS